MILDKEKKYSIRLLAAVFMLFIHGSMNVARAGSIEKAYEALSVHNYFLAKDIFEKKLKRHPVACGYGLSYIYSVNNNPFYDLDSARKYILKAEYSFSTIEEKERLKLEELQINSVKIQVLKSKVARLAFEQVKQSNSLAKYELYISKYPFALQLEDAVEMRNELAFAEARNKNTSAAYLEFIRKYPEANQLNEARRRCDKMLYLEQTAKGDIQSFVEFIRKYPDSPYVLEAMDMVYQKSIYYNTIEEYALFIKTYPDNRNVNKAWRVLYALYMKNYSPQRMAEFRLDYPDYPFTDELMKDFNLSFKKYYPIRSGHKWGFMDETGEEVVLERYDDISTFSEGLAIVSKGGKLGYIDKLGKIKIPIMYDEAEPFIDGFAVVLKEEKYGLINKANLVQIPFAYDEIGEFNDGIAYIAQNDLYGFIDIDNQLVVEARYDGCGDFDKGYAYVQKDGKYGIIDRKGDVVIPIEFDWLENFKEGFARVKKGDKFGLFNDFGQEVVPIQYDNLGIFSNGLCLVSLDDKLGYLNKEGKEAIPMQYQFELAALNWGQFKDGYAKIKIKDKFGLIDTTGKRFLPAVFEDVGIYAEKLIAVKKRGLWGFCDHEARLKIQYRYEYAWGFLNDTISKVRKDDKVGYINIEGNEEIYIIYDEISEFVNQRAMAMKDGLYGLIDNKNNVVISFEYDKLEYDGMLILATKNDKMSYIDPRNGRIIWQEKSGVN